ncbi:MAG: hypothetical protein IPM71_01150 [Bacteroidota bacterium]|nr:MAG: hypothetical protein IPM71_01150 [Bacteroidota bacterium]
MKLIVRTILFFLLWPTNLLIIHAQEITIKATLDTNLIELGGRVNLLYEVENPENYQVGFPEFQDTLVVAVEVLHKTGVDTVELKNNRIRQYQKLELTSFEIGKHFIAPQAFSFRSGAIVDTIYSKALYFEVVGVALDTTGTIRDIAALERAPLSFRDFLPLFVILFLVLLALAIVYFIKKFKKKEGLWFMPEKPKEAAHVIALRELDKLKAQNLWQQKQVKEYYSRLTNIIRSYIEARFGILAMEKPSSEVLQEVRKAGVDRLLDMKAFEALLNLADLIKFARGDAKAEENMEHLENAYKLVKQTIEVVGDHEASNKIDGTV